MVENKKLLREKKECCGCSACANICPQHSIEMIRDNDGFLFPHVNETNCLHCGLCLKTCPEEKREYERQEKAKLEKIKIINLQFTNNYGAIIAAAMLEKKIKELVRSDIDVQTLVFYYDIPADDFLNYHKDRAKDMQSWKAYIHTLRYPIIKSEEEKKLAKLRNTKFILFRNQFLNVTLPKSLDTLRMYPENDAALIVGSDVVWQTKRITSVRAPFYFLDFGNKNAKRIAYAASVDSAKINRTKRVFKNNLKRFNSISIREESTVSFVKKCTDKPVFLCCDPVFLYKAEDYNEMISTADCKQEEEKYIYAYILDDNPDIIQYCEKLSEKKGLNIKYYSNKKMHFSCNADFCATDGPAEFLFRLKNAEYIVTTSYHCLVFSLLFHKKFLSFEREFVKGKKSIKSPELLSYFDIKDRLITGNDIPDIDAPIDFNKIDTQISNFAENSEYFLRNALGNELLSLSPERN